MHNYKGVIFDLDGTLLNSMDIWKNIDIVFLGKRNIAVPEDYMNKIEHMCAYDTALYTIDRFNLKDTPEELIKEWVDMALEAYRDVQLKPGAEKYIDYLLENNIKIAIATATENEIADVALKNRSFADNIDTLVTVEQVKRGKGFADIYLRCAENMGLLPDECIVFEDILTGIKAASNAGFYTVGVYEKYSEKNIAEIRNSSDKFIYSFEEMLP